jgi:tungstate transport system substrate-binding protein
MYRTRILKIGLAAAAAGMAMSVPSLAAESIIVQSTTSTQNSGLYKHLLPVFKAKAGIQVNVVAVGTGQAIMNARNCDGDVLLVHAKPSEEKFVKARSNLMYNDFIIVGPPVDPAGVGGMKDAPGALKKIAAAKAIFASRGDNSGTHKKEVRLWKASGVRPRNLAQFQEQGRSQDLRRG